MILVQMNAKLEWQAVKDLMEPKEIHTHPYGESFQTHINNTECIFYQGGPTKTLSSGACQYALDRWAPEMFFVLGICGGVAAELQPLDIVLAEQTAQYDVEPLKRKKSIFYEMITLDNTWIDVEKFPYPMRKGLIASADQTAIANTCEKLRGAGVMAVDWETASPAKICSVNGVRCCVLRGVSDLASETEFNFETLKRNAPLIMERLIHTYLPELMIRYLRFKHCTI